MTRLVKFTCDIKAQFIFVWPTWSSPKRSIFLREKKKNIETRAKYFQKTFFETKVDPSSGCPNHQIARIPRQTLIAAKLQTASNRSLYFK